MIYYISLDNPNPSGGVKTQYRHVEILNKHGYQAAMLHQNPGFTAATWFDSNALVRNVRETEINPGDVLVWPEILRTSIRELGGVKQVIFNQNVHYTFRSSYSPGLVVVPTNPRYNYAHGSIGTMVLTEYERSFLQSVVPDHPVHVVRHGIDPGIFGYDGRPKKRQIAFMPRKHLDEAEAVIGWLASTGALKGWDIVEINQSTERETAEVLKDSAFFFAFGYPEGGTLPPFEALSAGAMVVGYGGFASDDLLTQAGGRVIASGDTCKFAAVASILIQNPHTSKEVCQSRSEKALGMFPMKGEEEQLLRFMREVVSV